MPDCFCPSCVSDLWSVPNPQSLTNLSAKCLVTFLIQETVNSLGSFQNSGSCIHGQVTHGQHMCHCKVSNRTSDVSLVISRYLTSFLPGGNLSRDTRELMLDLLATCLVDPRVPGAREVLWCGLIDSSVEKLQMEGGGLSRYHSGTSGNHPFYFDCAFVNVKYLSLVQ